ncbi:hypothetical protein QWZ13_01770 [Reinekea marina]|uniref:Uncharacterized protein n=1 Tax=Reinekea marina TaxID=1310421 RepID=A0ABV7WRX2_9GAMM|nr:hypothetical protein [Reinekea marina]MBU2864456.1 hypothetical protein [Reinekea forsetii]MDN3647633.1 hypothetical protein [Reinekea marina]
MKPNPFANLPVPPALVYLLHQLDAHGIGYLMYGEVSDAQMVFVDIEYQVASSLHAEDFGGQWSLVSPHFIAERALQEGAQDPISNETQMPEAAVIAYGGQEAATPEQFQALCEQVRYLRHKSPSRLVYHSNQPPNPMDIQQLIAKIKKSISQ